MLRKLLTVGALVVVAATMFVGGASAKSSNSQPAGNGWGFYDDGFSDGRLF